MKDLYPIKLAGIPKETIWGGEKIKNKLNIDCSVKTGEVWLLSVRDNEDCAVLNGSFHGKRMSQYLAENSPELLPFPLLIKFIDANDKLSVQVHPTDGIAKRLGDNDNGKTEVWHIIEADEGATIVYGLKSETDAEGLRRAVNEGRIEDVLNYVPVKAGDTFFIPAGLIHAIGKGILLIEIQQNSDTTYRFYDYNRLDATGKARPLHIEKALEASIMYSPAEIDQYRFEERRASDGTDFLACCRHFKSFRLELDGEEKIKLDDFAFCSVICIKGEALLKYGSSAESIAVGDSFYVPSGLKEFSLCGTASLVISFP